MPSQPIFALVVGVLLRIEWPSMLKCLGILLTFGGCAYIVLQRPKDESAADEGSPAVGSVRAYISSSHTSKFTLGRCQ